MQPKALLAAFSFTAMLPLSSASLGSYGAGQFLGMLIDAGGRAGGIAGYDNSKRDAMPLPVNDKIMQHGRRDDGPYGLPKGIPKYAVDDCVGTAKSMNIYITKKSSSELVIENVPAKCMNLATYFTDAASPHPCGSSCLKYEGLKDHQMQQAEKYVKKFLKPDAKVN